MSDSTATLTLVDPHGRPLGWRALVSRRVRRAAGARSAAGGWTAWSGSAASAVAAWRFPSGQHALRRAAPVLIDWGDCRIGHPVFDLIRLREWRGDDVAALTGQWCAHWRRVGPGCDPERAIGLVEPVVTLRYAMVYDMFVRSVEPSERPYHELDVPDAIDSTTGHSWRNRRVDKPATHI